MSTCGCGSAALQTADGCGCLDCAVGRAHEADGLASAAAGAGGEPGHSGCATAAMLALGLPAPKRPWQHAEQPLDVSNLAAVARFGRLAELVAGVDHLKSAIRSGALDLRVDEVVAVLARGVVERVSVANPAYLD